MPRSIHNVILATFAFFAALAGGQALAQGTGGVPNQYQYPDARGVDLATLQVATNTPGVAIGGLSWRQEFYYSGSGDSFGWRGSSGGSLNLQIFGSDYHYTLVIGSSTAYFTGNGGFPAAPDVEDGSAVTSASTVRLADGTVLTFGQNANSAGSTKLLTEVLAPSGDKVTYTYKVVTSGGCSTTYCTRLSSINSNSGYQIKLEYSNNSTASSDPANAWQTVTKATASTTRWNTAVLPPTPAAGSAANGRATPIISTLSPAS